MSKQKERMRRKRQKTQSRWLWIAGGGLVLVVAVLVWSYIANSTPRTNQNSLDIAASLPDSAQSFSVGTMIGKPAPAFTLPDAQGNRYQFQPGDGRKYVLAFNMGEI